MTHYRDEKLTIKQENGYPYKESVSSPSPTKKHVIYVEVMPASFLKLERSNNDDGCDNVSKSIFFFF